MVEHSCDNFIFRAHEVVMIPQILRGCILKTLALLAFSFITARQILQLFITYASLG